MAVKNVEELKGSVKLMFEQILHPKCSALILWIAFFCCVLFYLFVIGFSKFVLVSEYTHCMTNKLFNLCYSKHKNKHMVYEILVLLIISCTWLQFSICNYKVFVKVSIWYNVQHINCQIKVQLYVHECVPIVKFIYQSVCKHRF